MKLTLEEMYNLMTNRISNLLSQTSEYQMGVGVVNASEPIEEIDFLWKGMRQEFMRMHEKCHCDQDYDDGSSGDPLYGAAVQRKAVYKTKAKFHDPAYGKCSSGHVGGTIGAGMVAKYDNNTGNYTTTNAVYGQSICGSNNYEQMKIVANAEQAQGPAANEECDMGGPLPPVKEVPF